MASVAPDHTLPTTASFQVGPSLNRPVGQRIEGLRTARREEARIAKAQQGDDDDDFDDDDYDVEVEYAP